MGSGQQLFSGPNPFAAKKSPARATLPIPGSYEKAQSLLKQKQGQQVEDSARQEQVKEQDPLAEIGNSPLIIEQLAAVLQDEARRLQREGRNLEATLFKQRFQHEPPSKIRLFLNSEIQETVFLKHRPEFLLRLRRAFDHRDLQLDYEIREEQQSAAEKLYTSSDKFQYLLQKHPALGDFKRRFGLETDF